MRNPNHSTVKLFHDQKTQFILEKFPSGTSINSIASYSGFKKASYTIPLRTSMDLEEYNSSWDGTVNLLNLNLI